VGFFRRREQDEDAVRSLERIEQGHLPLAAERRLQELGAEGSMFTSGLSVSEFSLLGRLGPRPLAQVMGASVVRPGLQLLPALPAPINDPNIGGAFGPVRPMYNRITDASPSQLRNYRWHTEVVCELDVLTDAWNTARRRALARLADEARAVGADSVAGVHLHRGEHDLGGRTIDYVVTGTAIGAARSAEPGSPKLTDLSIQDLWRLDRAGYAPVGLLAASVVVFGSPPRDTRVRRARTKLRNQELGELSQAFHMARDSLRVRLRGQVADAHGDGAVGIQFAHSVHHDKLSLASSLGSLDRRGWQHGRLGIPYFVSGRGDADRVGWMVTMHVAGTAVRRIRAADPDEVKPSLRMGAR
jgi:uncharacterized protein YbjQ (UPF0145 family)